MVIRDYYANGTSYTSDIFEFYAMAVYKMDDILVRYTNKINNVASDFQNGGWDQNFDFTERFLRKNFLNDGYKIYYEYSEF